MREPNELCVCGHYARTHWPSSGSEQAQRYCWGEPDCDCKQFDADPDEQPETRIDLRIPVTVVFDFSIYAIQRGDVDAAIERLGQAVSSAELENLIADTFQGDGDEEVGSGTRYGTTLDTAEIMYREHAPSGGFDLPLSYLTAEERDSL